MSKDKDKDKDRDADLDKTVQDWVDEWGIGVILYDKEGFSHPIHGVSAYDDGHGTISAQATGFTSALYEYQVLYRSPSTGHFDATWSYYRTECEFREYWPDLEFLRFIPESKRARKL